ncbi:MAG: GNAT family N-acetyltransferase, partial [Campylobacterales bacterium]|nr:GNAT family N-acetyltransferase [Campylobacterales bacterium]
KENDTVIFLPLILWKKNWKNAFLHTIVPVGFSDYDYATPISINQTTPTQSEYFWKNLVQELKANIGIKFDKIEISGIEKKFCGDMNFWEETEECSYIDLKNYDTYESFLSYFKTKERSNVKRQIKRLEEQGDLKFEVLGSSQKDRIITILPTLLQQHALRWPNAYRAPNFHSNLVHNALDANLLYFSQLTLNNEPISWGLGFIYKKKFYFYMLVYVDKYAKFSPGKLNMFYSIEYLIEQKYEIFDFLRGSEEYKSKLPVHNQTLHKYIKRNNKLISYAKEQLICLKQYFQ